MESENTEKAFPDLAKAFLFLMKLTEFVYWVSPKLTRTSAVFAPYFSFVLFALMQKERKKSRAKYASTHMPSRHPAFGSGHRAASRQSEIFDWFFN